MEEPILDEKDRLILNEIQSNFPIVSRPYEELGRRLHMDPEEVFLRVKALKERGIIRRIGASFSSKGLNFASTLCAAKVPQEKLDSFVETVNNYPGVTHNYEREHEYNVWFTFIAKDALTISEAIQDIKAKTGILDIIELPAERTFKIKVDLLF